MMIYIVKNKQHEEMGAFTDLAHAIELAKDLRDDFDQEYIIEEILCDVNEGTPSGYA